MLIVPLKPELQRLDARTKIVYDRITVVCAD
jgi:hypothetical protein